MPKLVNLDRVPSRRRRPTKGELSPLRLSRADRRILSYLLEYRYVTPTLLGMLYAGDQSRGRGQSHVRHRLTQLWRHHLVERHYRPADVGSREYVYTLSVDGAKEIIPSDEWSHERRKVYHVAKERADFEHPLAIALFHVLWSLGSRGREDLFTTEAVWHDKQATRRRVINRFQARVGGEKVAVDPDLTLLIAHRQRDYFRPYLVELERSHKSYQRTKRRLLAYEHLLSSAGEHVVQDVFEKELHITPERGMVVFVANDDRAAERLRATAIDLVSRDAEFWFTSLERLVQADGAREVPIEPSEFFDKEILTALDGKSGRLVI